MRGVAQWFGAAERPLFGWVHTPEHLVPRASVVLCPSMGQEGAFTFYTMRQLAIRLARRGFKVVRFDYDGSGDSAGDSDDPDRVGSWVQSVGEAMELARSGSGDQVVLVGMRVGALLASEAAERFGNVHGLVLWDAPKRGATFIREQRVRQNTALGDDALTGDLTALGLTFTSETVQQLNQVMLVPASGALPCDLALTVDRPGHRSVSASGVTRSGQSPDYVEALDLDELLYRQTTPLATLDKIESWFEKSYPLPPKTLTAVTEQTEIRSSWTLKNATERIVRVGPHGLFGIVCEPQQPRSTTTVIFVPEYHTPHVGLSRVWTDLARVWADAGIRSLRFDLSGCNDSEPHAGLAGHRIGIVEHIEDVADAVRSVGSDPSDVIVIGLCSGAYLAMEASLRLAPRGAGLINPAFSFITAEEPVSRARQAIQLTRPSLSWLFGRLAGRLAQKLVRPHHAPILTLDPAFDWSRSFEACYWQNYLYRLFAWLPDFAWRALNRLLITQRPDQILERIHSGGTRILFLAGDPDWGRSTLGSMGALRRLERRGGFFLRHEPVLDHAMMKPGAKGVVMRDLTEFILDMTAGDEV